MPGNILVAEDTNSAKRFVAQGDKILYGPSETKDGKYLVAAALDGDEQQYSMLVRGCRVATIDAMNTATKPYIIFKHVATGGAVKLVAANLGHILWTRNFTSGQAVGLRYQLTQDRDVLLTYTDSGVLKYAYLDGTDGSTVGEFEVLDAQSNFLVSGVAYMRANDIDRETILSGWDFAEANDGSTVGGYAYFVREGWNAALDATAPDYAKFEPGMWATSPPYIGVGTTDPRQYFMTSTGWMKLMTENFRWGKGRTADAEQWQAAVQYAIVSENGDAPSVTITWTRVVKSERVTVSGVSTYTYTLISDTGNRITEYVPLDSGSLDSPVLNVVSGLGEVWLYGNTDGADYRNYHKFANDGTFIESVATAIAESDTHKASFSEESRYLLVGDDHDHYETIYDVDGADVTPSIGGSDTLINCYVLDANEYIQVAPGTPDTGSHTTYHQLWEPSGGSIVGKVIALSGSAAVWNHPCQVDGDYTGRYLVNGFGMGKGYEQTKYVWKIDDLAAGFSVIYFTVTQTITESSVDYVLSPGDTVTLRPAWIVP